MLEVLNIISSIIQFAIAGLALVVTLYLLLLLFKFLCTIHAEIVAEKVRNELEEMLEEYKIEINANQPNSQKE